MSSTRRDESTTQFSTVSHAEQSGTDDAVAADIGTTRPPEPTDVSGSEIEVRPVPPMPPHGVLVAMPAYNEASAIASVVEEAAALADIVLVVDDGSTDETVREAERAGAVVVRHPENRGYGAALKTIFTEATDRNVAHLVVIDADGQHTATDIPRLVAAQRETGDNVVIGSRFAEDARTDAPLYRRFGLGVINVLTNLSLGTVRADKRISDVQSGFRAYDSQVVASLAAAEEIGDRMGASLDILHHARKHGYRVGEIGTVISYDVDHTSSQHPLTHGLELVGTIARLTIGRFGNPPG